MKRATLHAAVIVSTIVLVTESRTFGDSKLRIGSGGQNRMQSMKPGSFTGRLGAIHSGSGNGGPNLSSALQGPGKVSGPGISKVPIGIAGRIKLPSGGVPGSGLQLGGRIQNSMGTNRVESTGPNLKSRLPGGLHNQIGNSILLPNGNKMKPVALALNATQILKHKGNLNPSQPQIQQIVAAAPKHLCHQPHFSWWVNLCHHHCHNHYGCWNIHAHYWDGWTTCRWQVVPCDHFTYYLGLNAVFIPDMQACGVQSVDQGSPAHLSGLHPGDLILTVNGRPIFDPNLINTELPKGRLDLEIVREGSATPLVLTVFPKLVQTVSF